MTVDEGYWVRRLNSIVQIGKVNCRILDTGRDKHIPCRRCCKEEHMARNCRESKAFCPLCVTKGHSAGSEKCQRGHRHQKGEHAINSGVKKEEASSEDERELPHKRQVEET